MLCGRGPAPPEQDTAVQRTRCYRKSGLACLSIKRGWRPSAGERRVACVTVRPSSLVLCSMQMHLAPLASKTDSSCSGAQSMRHHVLAPSLRRWRAGRTKGGRHAACINTRCAKCRAADVPLALLSALAIPLRGNTAVGDARTGAGTRGPAGPSRWRRWVERRRG